ncbi:LysR family transcriptional regulator [Streptomyces sp. NRRL F-5123]|uniref:LysR family transcriptional regulator n=1 Tax=Streptomyces sp. NRRL F-5123 TaxID=1463856 RepID=UPI00099D4E06
MDPHLLRTFVAVARLGSFSAAARELGYTQSAVSQHIAALESDLGAVLLGRRPVAPTPPGARLLEHAEPLLLRLDAARADIARLTAAPAARVVVGAAPTAVTGPLAAALAGLRRGRPQLDVTVRVLDRAAVVGGVTAGGLDAGLVDGAAAPGDPLTLADTAPLAALAVSEEPLAVALPAGHPLAGRAGVDLAGLSEARWIDAPGTALPLARLRTVSGTEGFRAALRYEGADVRGLLALCAAGHGLAVLPAAALSGAPGVHAVPVAAPRLVHRTEILHAKSPAEQVALLAAALRASPPDGQEQVPRPPEAGDDTRAGSGRLRDADPPR